MSLGKLACFLIEVLLKLLVFVLTNHVLSGLHPDVIQRIVFSCCLAVFLHSLKLKLPGLAPLVDSVDLDVLVASKFVYDAVLDMEWEELE